MDDNHHCHCPPEHHCPAPCSPPAPPPQSDVPQQFWNPFDSDEHQTCRVRVEVPLTAPLVERKPTSASKDDKTEPFFAVLFVCIIVGYIVYMVRL